MKKLLLLLMISVNSYAYSQTFINKKDEFTGKQIKSAVVLFGKTLAPVPMTLSFSENNGRKYIVFTWQSNSGPFGAFNNIKPGNTSLLFKMENDSIMRFKADSSLSKISNFQNTSIMALSSAITDKQLLDLANQRILKFRVGILGDSGVDLDEFKLFTDRNRVQVQKAAAYMLDMQVIANDN